MKTKYAVLPSLFFIIQLVGVLPLRAEHYYFKQISLKEGLPSNVRCILRDEQGFVWIGTKSGLLSSFLVFSKTCGHVPVGDTIVCILYDSGGVEARLEIIHIKIESGWRAVDIEAVGEGRPDEPDTIGIEKVHRVCG